MSQVIVSVLVIGLVTATGCSSGKLTPAEYAVRAIGLEVEEARAGDEAVYVRYIGTVAQSADVIHREMLHATATLIPEADAGKNADLDAPLEFIEEVQWRADAASAEPIEVLSVLQYDEIIDAIVEKITPQTPLEAVSVRADLNEFVAWRDADGEAHLDELVQVIAGLTLVDQVTPKRLRQVGLSVLPDLVPAETRRFLVQTGEVGPGAAPFVYVDIDRQLVNGLDLQGERAAQPLEPVGMTVDAGLHLVLYSFFIEILRSPVRMGTRTVFGVGYTVGDTTARPRANDTGPQEAPPLYEGPGMDLDEFEEVLDKVTSTKRVPGRIVRCLIGGDEYFPVLRDAIAKAEASIHLRTYLFDNDDYGVVLADQLKKRSMDGIDVKVLVDGLGTIIAGTVDSPEMPSDFQKPPKITWYLRDGSKVNVRSCSNPFTMGDHAKTTIIDSRTAFVGGMNLGRENRYEWHDIMVEVEGPVIDVLDQEFRNIWELAGPLGDWQFAGYSLFGKKVEQREDDGTGYPIRVLKTVPGGSDIYKAQLEAIKRAKKYIYIENLYFSNMLFLRELLEARQRGVDVRVVMPLQGNWGVLSESAMVTANKMFDAGIRVYMYPRMTHTKAAVYDGWVCLGSANFDKLSLRINEELNLCYTEPGAVRDLVEQLFEVDFETSTEMTERFDTTARHVWSEIITDQL